MHPLTQTYFIFGRKRPLFKKIYRTSIPSKAFRMGTDYQVTCLVILMSPTPTPATSSTKSDSVLEIPQVHGSSVSPCHLGVRWGLHISNQAWSRAHSSSLTRIPQLRGWDRSTPAISDPTQYAQSLSLSKVAIIMWGKYIHAHLFTDFI